MREVSFSQALTRLRAELERIGASHVVLSSNLETRLDGSPRSGQSEPADRGVCLYFQLRGRPTTMPSDRYYRVADNIAALAAHIAATRAIERHGVGTLDQMFTGFQAIRGPGPRPWSEVLGFKSGQIVSVAQVEEAWARLIREAHPDNGGTHARAAEINAARDEAMKTFRGFK